jgi:lipoic acid synthetase
VRTDQESLTRGRRPSWLRVKAPSSDRVNHLRSLMRIHHLHTVCEEAACPNIGECWNHGTATFLLLGDVCTRNCRFCNVQTGKPIPIDTREPKRVAETVVLMGLQHVVLTSVTRDDQADGGAHIFTQTIQEIRKISPHSTIEALIPDFLGNESALQMVLDAGPNVLNHNLETVVRLYPAIRPQAVYARSLQVLDRAKRSGADLLTKSGLMVGIGESWDELLNAMRDLRAVDCDVLTLGQYLQPSRYHVPIARYYTPEEFDALHDEGSAMGFGWVESGPLVRSSYHAEKQASAMAHIG